METIRYLINNELERKWKEVEGSARDLIGGTIPALDEGNEKPLSLFQKWAEHSIFGSIFESGTSKIWRKFVDRKVFFCLRMCVCVCVKL